MDPLTIIIPAASFTAVGLSLLLAVRMTRAERKAHSLKRELDGADDFIHEVANCSNRRDESLAARLAETEKRLDALEAAHGGGTWRTKDGRVVAIRDMATEHIRNCLSGGFAGPRAARLMRKELAHRAEAKRVQADLLEKDALESERAPRW